VYAPIEREARARRDLLDPIGAGVELSASGAAPVSAVPEGQDEIRKEAVEALTALGYNSTEALRAVSSVKDAPDVETLLKAALRKF
jgi:Holliday junction DNA helicase RuvA